jgi:hypothetical protein
MQHGAVWRRAWGLDLLCNFFIMTYMYTVQIHVHTDTFHKDTEDSCVNPIA